MTPDSLVSRRAGMELSWGAATDVGKIRRLNEDSLLVESGAFVVADGMGGHQAGDVASRLTVEAVRDMLSEGLPDIGTIGSIVQRANLAVRIHATSVGQVGMGSTLVGAFVVQNADEEAIVVVNVGDSRCYALVDGVVSQITADHSYVQELVDAGEITAEAALQHPERNVVTRAIGIEDVVAGDFFMLPSVPRTRLLLCSDGVSGELPLPQLSELLALVPDPAQCASALITAVLEGRAGDNATAIVVDITLLNTHENLLEQGLDVTGPRPNAVLPDPDITTRIDRLDPPSTVVISGVPDAGERRVIAIESEPVDIIDDVPR